MSRQFKNNFNNTITEIVEKPERGVFPISQTYPDRLAAYEASQIPIPYTGKSEKDILIKDVDFKLQQDWIMNDVTRIKTTAVPIEPAVPIQNNEDWKEKFRIEYEEDFAKDIYDSEHDFERHNNIYHFIINWIENNKAIIK